MKGNGSWERRDTRFSGCQTVGRTTKAGEETQYTFLQRRDMNGWWNLWIGLSEDRYNFASLTCVIKKQNQKKTGFSGYGDIVSPVS